MSDPIVGSLLVLIAVLHSVLGEVVIVRPLVHVRSWEGPLPWWQTRRIVRFAWHLTTFAWLGLAAIAFGASLGVTIAVVAFASAALAFVMFRGHLSWPLFFAIGFYSLDSADALPRAVLTALVVLAVIIAAAAALVHIGWAFGMRWRSAHTFPEKAGTSEPLGNPRSPAALVIAALLTTFVALLAVVAQGKPPWWAWWMTAGAALVLTVRTIGEGHYVGLLKTIRDTPFARLDDLLYTPLIVALAAGAVAALTLAGSPPQNG